MALSVSFRVRIRVRVRVRVSISIRFVACVVTSGECCRMIVAILSNLRNGLNQTDQSQHISQLVSQITFSHFHISHFGDYPGPRGSWCMAATQDCRGLPGRLLQSEGMVESGCLKCYIIMLI